MRQIKKHISSVVKNNYSHYNTLKVLQRLLMLVVFTMLCMFVQAQEAVHAGFSNFDYQGCVPITIQFADSSTGSPTQWYWDFGNGQTSTKSNPSATYTIPGTYTVKMVVKNAVSTDSAFKTIDISGAQAIFDYTYTDICNVPATLNFTVPTPRNKVIYRWDFGDTHKAIIPNPSNTYSAPGTYKVQLTTISQEGCADSIVKVIQIGNGTADIQAATTACAGDYVSFIDTSTPHALSNAWKINNNLVQQGTGNLTYQFTNAGIYNIVLAENFGTCQATASKQITILDKPAAAFSLTGDLKSCTYPSVIQFTNSSANAVAYKWYFGDGDSSAEAQPVHTYQAGRFSPTLIAFNANGCTDTLVQQDAVFLGGAIINSINLPDSGCIPHPVNFVADIATPELIASYAWDFGDGSTDATAQPSHIYTTSGRYDVSLTVKTISGCTTTNIISNAVSVGAHSVPDFTANKTVACGSEGIQFNGTANGPVSYWRWEFSLRDIYFIQNPRYAYNDTGKQSIKLIVSNSGCLDSVIKRNYIYVNPPVSSFRPQYDCNDRLNVKFIDRSIAPLTWLWDFGDGSTFNQQNPPLHSYTTSGKYSVTLTTTNGACSDIYRDTIYIVNTKPVFSFIPADGHLCRKADLQASVSNPSYILDYLWDLDDGRTLFSDSSIVYTYFKTGVYTPSLIARYGNGCQDTIFSPNPITVTGPTASFSTLLPAVCVHDTTTFIDKSFSDGTHAIVSHVWSYGDGIVESNSTAPYTHVYANSGSFTASLALADNTNCTDTIYYDVAINALPPVYAGLDTFVCEGSSVQLQATGGLLYNWKADPTLDCRTCATPNANPVQTATYIVTGVDANACRASDTIGVQVVHPFNLAVDQTPLEICATKSVQLNASGAEFYTWTPSGGLNDATINSPLASPDITTTYKVTGTDSKKCFAQTGAVTVTVHPLPAINVAKDSLLVEEGTQNTIVTSGTANIIKWNWSPPQGLSCTDCPQPTVVTDKTVTYQAVAYDAFGCTDTALVTVHVLCNQAKIYIPSAFTPNGDGKNERFYIKSNIDNPVRAFTIYNRAGQLIFSKRGNITNYSADGWDGTYKGIPVPAGTYIYRVEVVCNNSIVPLMGTVTLIR